MSAEIFYEYDRMIDRLARLYSYGNCKPPLGLDEVSESGERLAKDDLLNFAIHSRRLLTIVGKVSLATSVQIPTFKFKDEGSKIEKVKSNSPLDVWRVINTIVHHEKLEILNSSFRIRLYTTGQVRDVDALRKNADSLIPLILVSSDQVRPFCFELREFVRIFYEHVADPLIEYLSDKGVYVELTMREI